MHLMSDVAFSKLLWPLLLNIMYCMLAQSGAAGYKSLNPSGSKLDWNVKS